MGRPTTSLSLRPRPSQWGNLAPATTRARDVHGVRAFRSTTGLVGGKHLWSFMYQPAVFLSLIPNMNETKMADWRNEAKIFQVE
ncbi:unnamed protein product [Prunus armeniaca]